MNLKRLLESAAHVRSLIDQASRFVDRLQSVKARADGKLAELEKNESFFYSEDAHKQQVHAELMKTYRATCEPAAGVALYHLERAWPALETEIRAVRQAAKQYPTPISSYLARTGGQQVNLSDETELLIQLLDEHRRARFREDLRDAPPSVIRELYGRACESDDDESASLVRYVEARHGKAWAGSPTQALEEVEAAKALRTLINTTQELRIPAEVDEVAGVVQEAQRVASRAQSLYRVRPINPDQRPDVKGIYEAELQAMAEEPAS